MRKKLTFFTLLLASGLAFSQCNIIGKNQVNINEIAEYSVDGDAQCADCYQWRLSGNNAVVMDNGNQKNIKIKGAGVGQTVINATLLTQNGISQCSKVVDVGSSSEAPATPVTPQETVSNCDINIKDLKEAKVGETSIAFFPDATDSSFSYTWTVFYYNGDTKTSSEKIPQFPYGKELPIQKIKLKVISKKCYKEYTKTYNDTFWKFWTF